MVPINTVLGIWIRAVMVQVWGIVSMWVPTFTKCTYVVLLGFVPIFRDRL